MKTWCFAVLLMLFFSCTKDNNISPTLNSGKKYAVKFNVGGFTQNITTQETLSSLRPGASGLVPTDSLKSFLSDIYYFVYNSDGYMVHDMWQTTNPTPPWDYDKYDIPGAEFGKVTDSLAAGTYTIIVLAIAKPWLLNYAQLFGDVSKTLSNAFILLTGDALDTNPKDTFFKKMTISISDSDISKTISLDRIVGKLKIDVNNLGGNNSSYYTVLIKDKAGQLNLNNGRVEGTTETWYQNQSGSLTLLTMNVYTPFTVRIYGNYGTDRVVCTTIDSVRAYPNQTTVLSGNLPFSPPANGSQFFNVRLNGSWDSSDTTKISF